VSGLVEVALFTDDVDRLRAFYEHVLGRAPEASWPGGAVYAAGAVKLLVHERAGAAEEGPPNEDHVAIDVESVDGACAKLRKNGIELLVEARDYPWGRSAYLRDPDGRLVELAQA
jgi:catechol 2,3-dioxygenase-like lactoylglutathione lyase family enzyme